MCVAIGAVKKWPTLEQMENCEWVNDDGAGIGWIEEKTIKWKKGLESKDIQKLIDTGEAKLPAVIHFRFATSAMGCEKNDKRLCHPFPLTGKVETGLEGQAREVLIHNGHWSAWSDEFVKGLIQKGGKKLPEGPMSDSRAIAWLTVRFGRKFLDYVEGQKIGILQASNRTFFMWGKWEEDEKDSGLWFSNGGYRARRNYSSSSTVRGYEFGGSYGYSDYGEGNWSKDRTEYEKAWDKWEVERKKSRFKYHGHQVELLYETLFNGEWREVWGYMDDEGNRKVAYSLPSKKNPAMFLPGTKEEVS